MGWDCGAFWTVDHDREALRCAESWCDPSLDFPRFLTATQEAVFGPGEGLPGSVWASGESR